MQFFFALSEENKNNFSNWVEKIFDFSVVARRSGGHISLIVKEEHTDIGFNLADIGYGFSQLLPILAQIWSQSRITDSQSLRILAIEQPELHLHPALQAKIADALVSTVRSENDIGESGKGVHTGLFVIVETHSEALVNRLGELISDGKLQASDVSILVFDKALGHEFTNVTVSRFDKDGSLRNWPYGFFSSTFE